MCGFTTIKERVGKKGKRPRQLDIVFLPRKNISSSMKWVCQKIKPISI
jgi:hypothetical protein